VVSDDLDIARAYAREIAVSSEDALSEIGDFSGGDEHESPAVSEGLEPDIHRGGHRDYSLIFREGLVAGSGDDPLESEVAELRRDADFGGQLVTEAGCIDSLGLGAVGDITDYILLDYSSTDHGEVDAGGCAALPANSYPDMASTLKSISSPSCPM